MQSVDATLTEGDYSDVELTGNNDVLEPKTLPELSNDVDMTKSCGVNGSYNDNVKGNYNDKDDYAVVLEPKTLPELSNETVIMKSVDETLSFQAELVFSDEGLNQEGEGLEMEEGDGDMEVDFVENSGRVLFEGSENLVEGIRGFVNGTGNGVEASDSKVLSEQFKHFGAGEGNGCGTSEPIVDGVDNQGSFCKASFGSSAQTSSSVAVNEVKEVGIDESLTIIGDTVEVNEVSSVVENQAIVSDKENIKHNVTNVGNEGVSVPKGMSGVLDFDSSVVSSGNKSKKKGGFCTSDLVWGKVRSHPWWPAQIFEPEDASKQAKKHFKSKTYLLAYFGDKTFAWNEEAKLKPFAPHFPKMAKQSTAEAFQDAVECALDEAARRAEFGLSCRCIAEDVYSRLQIQVIENAGIQEKVRVQKCRDRLYNASTFEPVKFLDYVKNLAQVPHVEENVRLEHVVVHAQMSAFYRWKGCYYLAEFGSLKGYVNNEADASLNEEKEVMCQLFSDGNLVPQEEREEDIRPVKRKKMLGDIGNSMKKVKRFSVSMREKDKIDANKEDDDDDWEDIEGKTGMKFVSFSVKRGKQDKMSLNESKCKESSPQITPAREPKPSGLKVGESMLRAALQLSQPSPLLKPDVSSHGKTTKGSNKTNQRSRNTEPIQFKKSSTDAILSKYLLTAVDPLKDHIFLNSIVNFFSDFRDSVVKDVFLLKHGEFANYDMAAKSWESPSESVSEEMAEGYSSGSKVKEIASDGEITTSPDIIIKDPERRTFFSDEEMVQVDPEIAKTDGKSTVSMEIDSSVSGSQEHCVSENVASESGPSGDDMVQDESPTALTLKFTDMDSIPTETKLNKIFSAFGPLKESETEVLAKKNCARVVFKRRVDAETAFSSSGKFETFGASLVCYQLNYAPSPRKSTSPEAKRRKKEGTIVEGIAA